MIDFMLLRLFANMTSHVDVLICGRKGTPIIEENIIEPFFSQQKGLYSLFKGKGKEKSAKKVFI